MKINYKPLFQDNFFRLVKSDIELQKEIEKEIDNLESLYNQKSYRIKNITFLYNNKKINGFMYGLIPKSYLKKINSNSFMIKLFFTIEGGTITLFDIVFY